MRHVDSTPSERYHHQASGLLGDVTSSSAAREQLGQQLIRHRKRSWPADRKMCARWKCFRSREPCYPWRLGFVQRPLGAWRPVPAPAPGPRCARAERASKPVEKQVYKSPKLTHGPSRSLEQKL